MSVAATWGTTAEERSRPYPCDAVLEAADASLFRGVSVDAAAGTVYRWLCQLRAAPYSYDWIDNGGRRSPRHLTEGLEDLAAGQPAMRIFEVVSFEEGEHLTLIMRRGRWIFGDVAVSYTVTPVDGRTRLVAKLMVRYPRAPIGWLMRPLLPWGDLVMMRRQLLNLKHLAESAAPNGRMA